jgi:hypothetical protein
MRHRHKRPQSKWKMSYKTTISAAVSAVAQFVLFAQQLQYIHFPNWALALALFASLGGLAAFGVTAKDSNVTGGTIGQPSSPKALLIANQEPSVENPPQVPPK